MKKVSDYTRKKLNLLICEYVIRFLIIALTLIIIKTMEIVPVNMFDGLFYGILIIFLLFWVSERKPIVSENGNDIMREDDIKNFCAEHSRGNLRMNGEWIEKKFSSAHLIGAEVDKELNEYFEYKIVLDTQTYNNIISRVVEANIYFITTGRHIFNIKTTDYFWLLPYALDTNDLLEQIFASVTNKYHRKKKMAKNMDYTTKALSDGLKKIDKHINDTLIKNISDVLHIFLSEEEFQIAGKIIKGKDNKELFLLTGIKTEKQEIVLFPTKTLASITNYLYTRLLY